jgi:hypothetical protein
LAAALQGTSAGRKRFGRSLQGKTILEIESGPALETQDHGICLSQVIWDDEGRLRRAQIGRHVVRDGACQFRAGLPNDPERKVEVSHR